MAKVIFDSTLSGKNLRLNNGKRTIGFIMSKLKLGLVALLAGILSALSASAFAEQKQTLGEWDVHYMVVSTPFLTPEVAANYGIVRSKFNR